MIVQACRSVHFTASDPDSILILQFRRAGAGCVVELVHANVPVQDHKGVRGGWPTYYWRPWKKYLARRKKRYRNGEDAPQRLKPHSIPDGDGTTEVVP
jgi:hypothetical protein